MRRLQVTGKFLSYSVTFGKMIFDFAAHRTNPILTLSSVYDILNTLPILTDVKGVPS